MFCPQCGSNQNDELKFCKVCGANLQAVRQAVATRETGEKIDWSKTWVAEMFMSGEEAARRKAELERLQGLTPDVKRYNEIKAGVITASIGLAVAIFLFVFMNGLILSGKVSSDTAEILSRLWIAGVIPLFIGLALIFNGLFVSKKQAEISGRGPADRAEHPRAQTRSRTRSAPPTPPNSFLPTSASRKRRPGTSEIPARSNKLQTTSEQLQLQEVLYSISRAALVAVIYAREGYYTAHGGN